MRRISLICVIMLCVLCGCDGVHEHSDTQWVLDGNIDGVSADSDEVSDVNAQISAFDTEVSDLMSELVVYGERTQKWVNFLRSDRYTVRYIVADGGTENLGEHDGVESEKREFIVIKDGSNFAYRYTDGFVRYFQVDGLGHFIDDARKCDVLVERALVDAENVAYSLDLKYEGTAEEEIDGVQCVCERHKLLGLSDGGGTNVLKRSEHFGVTVSGGAFFYYDKGDNLIMIRVSFVGSDGYEVSDGAVDESAWVSELRIGWVSEDVEQGAFDVPEGYRSVDEATYMAEEEAVWSGRMVVEE